MLKTLLRLQYLDVFDALNCFDQHGVTQGRFSHSYMGQFPQAVLRQQTWNYQQDKGSKRDKDKPARNEPEDNAK